jgi:gamma-glutamyltranspeptidase/glutathione hydrolase
MTQPSIRRAGRAAGHRGAAATGHPLATAAALGLLDGGGNAVDAAVAAHAVLSVALPGSCGVGGDALFLVRRPDGAVAAYNGTGASAAAGPARGARDWAADGGASVTVPGAVAAWWRVLERHGSAPPTTVFAPAVRAAGDGVELPCAVAEQVTEQRARLERGGAGGWALLAARPGEVVVQPQLAAVLQRVAAEGPEAFYTGPLAEAISRAVRRDGGTLAPGDLVVHETVSAEPVTVGWGSGRVHVQPPVSQGVLLAMALQWLDRHADLAAPDRLDHLGVELTEAVFGYRDRCAREGAALLREPLEVDPERAARRGGPQPYLHTTGVAVADADGTVVSSLLTLFDDFGAGTFVPEGGFVLTNRGAGFTAAPNEPGPGRKPVHTLAPAIVEGPSGVTAIATPGADGQVQTLLQVLARVRFEGASLADAVGAPRWRSVASQLHVEASHPGIEGLRERGHDLVTAPDGDGLFGAVVSASWSGDPGTADRPATAVGDWRRGVAAGGI